MQGFFRLYEVKFKTFLNTFLRPSKKKKKIYYFCHDSFTGDTKWLGKIRKDKFCFHKIVSNIMNSLRKHHHESIKKCYA